MASSSVFVSHFHKLISHWGKWKDCLRREPWDISFSHLDIWLEHLQYQNLWLSWVRGAAQRDMLRIDNEVIIYSVYVYI